MARGPDTLRRDERSTSRPVEDRGLITRVQYRNYKLLREVCLDLGPLNVVVGRNGIGKSSLLEGLHFLLLCVTARDRSPLIAPGSLEGLYSRPDASDLEVQVKFDRGGQFGVAASRLDGVSAHFAANSESPPLSSGPPLDVRDALFGLPYAARLGEVVRLKLHAEALAEDSPIREKPRIEFDGSGLPSVLWEVLARRDGTLEAIEADLRGVVKGARQVRVQSTTLHTTVMTSVTLGGQETFVEQPREMPGVHLDVEFERVGWIPSSQLSEGTLLVLGLLTLLRNRPPRIVLLDDIDKALHPVAQRGLVTLLRGVLAAKPDLQILATSHSPFVLDALSAEEAFVVGAAGPGESRVRRLDAHPAWAKRKDFMHPGEFWSAVGEDWVAENGR